MTYRFLAAVAALALSSPAHSQAQEDTGSAGQHADHHLVLATALANDTFITSAFRYTMEASFDSLLRADPEMQVIEAECPGILGVMGKAIEPILWPSYRSIFIDYRADLHNFLRREISGEDARGATEFFNSALGRRFQDVVLSQITLDATMAELMVDEDAEVSDRAVNEDTREMVSRGVATLEPADRLEIDALFRTTEWGKAFVRLQPQIMAMQNAIAVPDATPEEDAAMDAAIEKAAGEHFAACYSE